MRIAVDFWRRISSVNFLVGVFSRRVNMAGMGANRIRQEQAQHEMVLAVELVMERRLVRLFWILGDFSLSGLNCSRSALCSCMRDFIICDQSDDHEHRITNEC